MAKVLHVTNAFSINMLNDNANLSFICIPREAAESLVKAHLVKSHIGHADMASVVSSALGSEIPMVRDTYTRSEGDILLVAQYHGPRLEEGTTELPEGATIGWWLVADSQQ